MVMNLRIGYVLLALSLPLSLHSLSKYLYIYSQGYVGEGMLTAAVAGNVFASPSVSSILACIRKVTGRAGALLIVKNYTGDRLNFGMALEKAVAEGLSVKMVVVADDCALEDGKGITGGRGIAGTVFVHKIAGAVAKRRATLDEVF